MEELNIITSINVFEYIIVEQYWRVKYAVSNLDIFKYIDRGNYIELLHVLIVPGRSVLEVSSVWFEKGF